MDGTMGDQRNAAEIAALMEQAELREMETRAIDEEQSIVVGWKRRSCETSRKPLWRAKYSPKDRSDEHHYVLRTPNVVPICQHLDSSHEALALTQTSRLTDNSRSHFYPSPACIRCSIDRPGMLAVFRLQRPPRAGGISATLDRPQWRNIPRPACGNHWARGWPVRAYSPGT